GTRMSLAESRVSGPTVRTSAPGRSTTAGSGSGSSSAARSSSANANADPRYWGVAVVEATDLVAHVLAGLRDLLRERLPPGGPGQVDEDSRVGVPDLADGDPFRRESPCGRHDSVAASSEPSRDDGSESCVRPVTGCGLRSHGLILTRLRGQR